MRIKRLLTVREEQAYRLCHHDFEGLTKKHTAYKMGIKVPALNRLLRNVQRKVPRLFPILSKLQNETRTYIVNLGYTHQEIADLMGFKVQVIDRIVQTLRNKGICLERPHKTQQYQPFMDGQIKEKF